MADEKKIRFTQEGYDLLMEELSNRKQQTRVEIANRIEEARSQGDLSENSEYDDAREAQAKNESRIHEIEELIKRADIIADDEIDTKVISVGSTVTLKDMETKKEETYTLVGLSEENLFTNKISEESPVGKAIKGKKKGNTVDVTTPSGIIKYKIVKIGK